MNEATKSPSMGAIGELNTTVIAVVAIGVVALFFNLLWPSIKANVLNSTKCSSATNCQCTGKTCKCIYFSETKAQEVTCPNNNIKK